MTVEALNIATAGMTADEFMVYAMASLETISMAAVTRDGMNLEWVASQTPALISTALSQNQKAFQFVENSGCTH